MKTISDRYVSVMPSDNEKPGSALRDALSVGRREKQRARDPVCAMRSDRHRGEAAEAMSHGPHLTDSPINRFANAICPPI